MTIPVRPSPLDDPVQADFAWSRYRRLMCWMGLFTASVVAACLVYLHEVLGDVPIHLYIATTLGISLMMMLTGALMGLVFLSSGTGHDEAVDNGLEQHVEDWWK